MIFLPIYLVQRRLIDKVSLLISQTIDHLASSWEHQTAFICQSDIYIKTDLHKPTMAVAKETRYPCGACSVSCCFGQCIFCENCHTWFHRVCETLTSDQLRQISENRTPYVCSVCCLEKNSSTYDYNAALSRLSQASALGLSNLRKTVEMEGIFLRSTRLRSYPEETRSHPVDDASLFDLLPYGGDPEDLHYLPVSVSGKKNCLFHALSVSLYGDKATADELRLRTCIELVCHGEFYRKPDIAPFSPDLQEDCVRAISDSDYCSAGMIAAAATVIGQPIRSVYPPRNGLMDLDFMALNRIFYPRGDQPAAVKSPSVVVMWSRMLNLGEQWAPDHFVPLVPRSRVSSSITIDGYPQLQQSTDINNANLSFDKAAPQALDIPTQAKRSHAEIDIDDMPVSYHVEVVTDPNTTPTMPHLHQTAKKIRVGDDEYVIIEVQHFSPTFPNMDQPRKKDNTDMACEADTSSLHVQHSSPTVSSCSATDPSPVRLLSSDHDYMLRHGQPSLLVETAPASQQFSEAETILQGNSAETGRDAGLSHYEHDQSKQATSRSCVTASGGQPNLGLQLKSNDLIMMMLKGTPSVDKIPVGIKENMYFLIDGGDLLHRRQTGQKAVFWDDCGAYNRKTTMKTAYFICRSPGEYMYIEKQGEVYVSGSKRVPLDPQPLENDLFLLRRYYTTLKRCPTYKRRISWLEKVPSSVTPPTCYCVEYTGTYPKDVSAHGNAKSARREYVRTQPQVLQQVKDLVKVAKPKNVYMTMTLVDPSHAPRDIKQVQNAKYSVQKEKQPASSRPRRKRKEVQTQWLHSMAAYW